MPPIPKMKVAAGAATSYCYQTPNRDGTFGGIFSSTDSVTASVWAGDGTAALAAPTCAWGGTYQGQTVSAAAGAPLSIWTAYLTPSDAAGLAPGVYRMQVYGTHAGAKGVLWDGTLDVTDSPSTGTLAGLITPTYCESALTRLRLSREERDFLPNLITTASDTVRKWCGQRDFTRTIYTEEYTTELNGQIALRQMPVNNVLRIRGYPQTVLNITAAPSTFQQAWVSYTTTGDWYSNTLVFTGLVLNSVNTGVYSSTPILFAGYPTVGQLAAAIGSVAGWTANTQGAFANFPTADLSPPGGVTAQGAQDDDGVELRAYTEDLTCCRVDNAIGFLWVGRHRVASAFGGRWGPEWEILDGSSGDPIGRVQVTYDAGFTVIPSEVQLATAELVKAIVERFRTDHMMLSESVGGAGSRMYQIAEGLMGAMPRAVLYGLSKWRMGKIR